ncbi:MAG: hypothetical protein JEZ04_07920 [Spirochaetales bacterium]|nr:hypothetical protein [Spirochaetales bacterium]
MIKKKHLKEVIVPCKPEVCPSCGFSQVGDIIYSNPEQIKDLRLKIEEGSIILGGLCTIEAYHPQWACKKCGCEIYKEDELSDEMRAILSGRQAGSQK